MIKKLIFKIRGSIWFIPVVYSILAFFLALIIIFVDHNDMLDGVLPSFLLTNVELAQTILGSISAALLTMTTITFSTIMVVLTTYSSQFSPRTLNNFVEAPITMRVLGIFMGGFVYSILALLFMNKNWYESQVISATVSVAIALVCLAFFAYFIHNVATSIQVSTLISDLTEETFEAIRKQRKLQEKENIKVGEKWEKPDFNYKYVKKIKASEYGYIQLMDFEKLTGYTAEHNLIIEVDVLVGDFVTEASVLFTIYHSDDDLELELNQFIKIGKERSSFEDPEFGVMKIVEIALRAISPGINDPNTARNCILHLGMILAELFRLRSNGRNIVFFDSDKKSRVLVRQKEPKEILYISFYQIINYGKQDFSILLAIIEAFILIGNNADDSVKNVLREMYGYSLKKFNTDDLQEMDLVYLNAKKKELSALIGKSI